MGRQTWRYETLPANTKIVEEFCDKYNLLLEYLNQGYQLRIEHILDIYPVRAKYHILATGERGEWRGTKELGWVWNKAVVANSDPNTLTRRDVDASHAANDYLHNPRRHPWWQFWRKK